MKIDKGLLTIVGVTIALFVALISIASPSNQNNPQLLGASQTSNQANPLTATELFFDFGTISMGKGKVNHTFKISNPTQNGVKIGKIYTSCMCTVATLIKDGKRFGPYGMPGHAGLTAVNETIEPGQETEIEVVFDPAAHGPSGIGTISREILIEPEGTAPLKLSFRANVTP